MSRYLGRRRRRRPVRHDRGVADLEDASALYQVKATHARSDRRPRVPTASPLERAELARQAHRAGKHAIVVQVVDDRAAFRLTDGRTWTDAGEYRRRLSKPRWFKL